LLGNPWRLRAPRAAYVVLGTLCMSRIKRVLGAIVVLAGATACNADDENPVEHQQIDSGSRSELPTLHDSGYLDEVHVRCWVSDVSARG
jgi:hypothetical protein